MWTADAVCATVDPEVFFPHKGGNAVEAKQVCASCPVVEQCLGWALEYEAGLVNGADSQVPHGVFGGLSANERIAILKKRREALASAA